MIHQSSSLVPTHMLSCSFLWFSGLCRPASCQRSWDQADNGPAQNRSRYPVLSFVEKCLHMCSLSPSHLLCPLSPRNRDREGKKGQGVFLFEQAVRAQLYFPYTEYLLLHYKSIRLLQCIYKTERRERENTVQKSPNQAKDTHMLGTWKNKSVTQNPLSRMVLPYSRENAINWWFLILGSISLFFFFKLLQHGNSTRGERNRQFLLQSLLWWVQSRDTFIQLFCVCDCGRIIPIA